MRKALLLLFILSFSIAFVPIMAQDVIPIGYGETMTSTITDDQTTYSYSFTGTAGDLIYVAAGPVDNGGLALVLRLFTGTGALLAEFDGELFNGPIVGPVELGADGNYTIAVSRPDWNEASGDIYVLVDTITPEVIETETVTGTLGTRGAVDLYSFQANEGELASFHLFGTEIGFGVFSPIGELLFVDGFYDSLDLAIARFPATGEYTVLVQTMAPDGDDYELTVREPQPIALTSGEPAPGTMLESDPAFFSFEESAGKMVQLSALLPSNTDRWMEVFYLENREWWDTFVVSDYGSGPDNNPRIDPFIIPEDGTYYVFLYYDEYSEQDVEGAYEMMLEPSSLVSLAPGTEVTGIASPETGDRIYAFSGKAGDLVRVTLRRISEEGAPVLNIFSPEDDVSIFAGRSARAAQFELELPIDGQYRFIVANIDYEPTEMEFSLLLEWSK